MYEISEIFPCVSSNLFYFSSSKTIYLQITKIPGISILIQYDDYYFFNNMMKFF